jgi:hypothetical protein
MTASTGPASGRSTPAPGSQRNPPLPASRRGAPNTARLANCRLALKLVANRFALQPREIVTRRRGSRRVVRARQAAMYLAHVALGVPLIAVGKAFRRDHTTASHAVRRVEDQRDDPAFDAALADLELAARIVAECEAAEPRR